jgi:hypothetical protein
MFTSKAKLAVVPVVPAIFLAGSHWLLSAAAPTSGAAPALQALSAPEMEKLHRQMVPQPGELNWAAVPWQTSITLARHQAAAENKPLCIFADTGAGFADALGLC